MNKINYKKRVIGGVDFVVPDRYELSRLIGKGAYGQVSRAFDKVLKKHVAVKKIQDVFTHSQEFQKRILREILILCHFTGHDNIINLEDLIMPPDFDNFKDIYLVFEFMDSDMRNLLRSKQCFTLQNVKYFLYQILRGLKYMHSASVLHRDLKPANVLVNKQMDVKLCDFGLSRGVDFDTNPTMSTNYVATRWYRSPELLTSWDKVNPQMDVWSVGCIFAEFLQDYNPLTGKRQVLFPGTGWLDQINRILDFVGTPKDSSKIRGCDGAKKYILKYSQKTGTINNQKEFQKMFPKANDQALDLLKRMLDFDPMSRISVDECLKHDFLAEVRCEESVPTCKKFDFRFSDQNVKKKSIKQIIYNLFGMWNVGKNKKIQQPEIVI